MSESIVLMTIGPLLTIVPNIPPLFVGQPGAISFSATGAEGLLRWTLLASDLPGEWDAALTITDGVAALEAATLATPGSYSVRVRVSDATRIPVEQTFSVRIVALPIEVSGTLDAWTVTVAITDVLTLSGGTGDYVSVTAITGALPAGASVALVGDELQFTGSPTGSGAWSVVLRVTDSAGAYLDIPLSGTVGVLPLTITGGPLLDAVEGEAYSDTLTISGGVPPYSLGTVTGVPAGMSVDIDGSTIEFTGTADAGESDDSPFSLSIEVEDAEAETEVYTQSFVVSAPALPLVWDSAAAGSLIALEDDDTTARSTGAWMTALGSIAHNTGKRQFECIIATVGTGGARTFIGIGHPISGSSMLESFIGRGTIFDAASRSSIGYLSSGDIWDALFGAIGASNIYSVGGYTAGDIITVGVDFDNSDVLWFKNGSLIYTFNGAEAMPAYRPAMSSESNGRATIVGSGLTYPISSYTDWAAP